MEVRFTLYTMAQGAQLLQDLTKESCSPTWLRELMSRAGLPIYKMGKVDLVTERDILKLAWLPREPRGRPKRAKNSTHMNTIK